MATLLTCACHVMCTGFCCRLCPTVSTDNEASVRYGFGAFTPPSVCEGLSYVHYIYISVKGRYPEWIRVSSAA